MVVVAVGYDKTCQAIQVVLLVPHLRLSPSSVLSAASFLGVTSLNEDRFLSTHRYLSYQELVTHRRLFAVVVLMSRCSEYVSCVIQIVVVYRYYLGGFYHHDGNMLRTLSDPIS